MPGEKTKNVMDKVNYTKKRLIESLKSIALEIEEGEEKDVIDLHLSHVIQEIEKQPPFLDLGEKGKFCSFCLAKEGGESLTEDGIL